MINYYIDKNFLDVDSCDFLIEQYRKDSNYYSDKFYNIFSNINEKIKAVIKEIFNEDVFIDNFTIRHYLPFEKKSGMKMHQDHLNWTGADGKTRDVQSRIFTTVCVLNQRMLGGRFRLEDRYIFPQTGQLIALRSPILHGVETITQGERFTLLTWYRGDRDRGDLRKVHLGGAD